MIKRVEVDGITIKPRIRTQAFDGNNIIIERQGKRCLHEYTPTDRDIQTKTPDEIGRDILEDFQNAAYLGSLTYQEYIEWRGGYADPDSRENYQAYKRANKGLHRIDPLATLALKEAAARMNRGA